MKRIFIIIFFALLAFICSQEIPIEQAAAQWKKAPKFALFNTRNKMCTLSQLIGDTHLILSFWASYCGPCLKEMPQIIELEKKYGDTKKVKAVFINIEPEGKEKALAILEDKNISNDCLLDIYQETAKKYLPDLKIPAIFLINKWGYIVFQAIGENKDKNSIEDLEKAILSLK